MSKKKVGAAANTDAVATQAADDGQILVYVGPTVKGVAEKYRIFNNGLSAELIEAGKNEPAFLNLVVPVEKLAASQAEIESQSGALYAIYEKAAKYKA